jgi:hypothetical protein
MHPMVHHRPPDAWLRTRRSPGGIYVYVWCHWARMPSAATRLVQCSGRVTWSAQSTCSAAAAVPKSLATSHLCGHAAHPAVDRVVSCLWSAACALSRCSQGIPAALACTAPICNAGVLHGRRASTVCSNACGSLRPVEAAVIAGAANQLHTTVISLSVTYDLPAWHGTFPPVWGRVPIAGCCFHRYGALQQLAFDRI